ncbi:hypothetical protein T4D_16027 [Trichinella pseudospiralis]|uniref:Uncharacterized protein n=1 Tax=Trichinella pseudospiralis TaxID=6337 RepID=A0A0V1FJL9_TRIPS|nr:hypothetical protein T4D_16027 [Trichinella pseudospiralis]
MFATINDALQLSINTTGQQQYKTYRRQTSLVKQNEPFEQLNADALYSINSSLTGSETGNKL